MVGEAMRIHYLQHVPFENPGTILTWAAGKGHPLGSTHLYKAHAFPSQEDFDWLFVMGGPMDIYEEEHYPWLADEKRFIKASIEAGKVVVGLCLGAQLIADVLGGEVTRNRHTEIGWFPVTLTKAAKNYEPFGVFPEIHTVFQWHGDTFSTLPEEAVLLATSRVCAHQAFMYKQRVVGFQYHLENTRETIAALIEKCADEMIPSLFVQEGEEMLSHEEHIENCNNLMDRFLDRLENLYEKGELHE